MAINPDSALSASLFDPPVPDQPHRYQWGQLYGASTALAIASCQNQHTGFVLVATDSIDQALQLSAQLAFFTDAPIYQLPHWETLPYDQISPHQDIISSRLETLHQLPHITQGFLIAPVHTLIQRLPPRSYIDEHVFRFHTGQTLDFEQLLSQLQRAGYRRVQQVMEHGEFAVRGEIVDIFPMGQAQPLRLDFFDNEIETLRSFDPASQRSTTEHPSVKILPAREFPLDKEGLRCFNQHWQQQFAEYTESPVYQAVNKQHSPAGVEYYLPLFFPHTDTIFDYLPTHTLCVHTAPLAEPLTQAFEEYQNRHQLCTEPALSPAQLVLRSEEFLAHCKQYPQVHSQHFALSGNKAGHYNFANSALPSVTANHKLEEPLQLLLDFIQGYQGRILFVAESPGRKHILKQMLIARNLPIKDSEHFQHFMHADIRYGLTIGEISEPLLTDDLCIISEAQLFGSHIKQRRRKKQRSTETSINSLIELQIDDPVVHVDNGVGRYRGLKTLNAGGQIAEYLILEYAKQDILYIPIDALDLIHRYTGADADHAPMHRLGSGQWDKAKRKAKNKAHDIAAELLEIYAKREAAQSTQVIQPDEAYQLFAAAFAFEPTADQQQAIDAVIADMGRTAPMDRLICGDVGFGKTEVAMRAAFLAAHQGMQVAVLVPTTLLAQQHYQSFLDRFADWPIEVVQLSRFQQGKQTEASLKKIAHGSADIVIGTHKLLSKEVQFKNLGLLVIDEEHRFGVKQKEAFKALRAEIDILTLTATPIPRTLNLSISGLRDLSIIATPPDHRMAIQTFVHSWDAEKITESCQRELHRGGQVYFLHNQVSDIERISRELQTLLPEARIGIAHGQMPEKELEAVMHDFYHRTIQVLVCTTIIETGLDVPTANTIIINRADKLGLAQLYQIRGRVGRSHHRAYAYLIVPEHHSITDNARKRLEAIESIQELGAGFSLALQDMEIRGTGEILGKDQSGQITEVGFTLYNEILTQAVADLKDNKPAEAAIQSEVNLGQPALLPEDYMPDVNQRLVFYKRIAQAQSEAVLDDIQVELIDRFGLLPDEAKTLFTISLLKQQLATAGVQKVDANTDDILLHFAPKPHIDPAKLIGLIQTQAATYRLQGQDRLHIRGDFPNPEKHAQAIRLCLEHIRLS